MYKIDDDGVDDDGGGGGGDIAVPGVNVASQRYAVVTNSVRRVVEEIDKLLSRLSSV